MQSTDAARAGPVRVEIAYNPASGGFAPARLAALAAAFEARGAAVRLSPTGTAPVTIAADTERLCIAGGDGTVRHVAHALHRLGRPLAVAVFPTGTINLIHREAGLPADPHAVAARLLGADRRDCYAVAVGDTLFLACAGVGPEADAVARVSTRLKRRIGRLAYPAAMLPLLTRWPRPRIRLEVNGRTMDCEAFHVAKGRLYAGRWTLSPAARLGAAEMRLVLLRTARRRDVARFWAALLAGRDPARLPFVETIACTAFTAHADAPLPVQADGDIAARLPARFRLVPTPFALA